MDLIDNSGNNMTVSSGNNTDNSGNNKTVSTVSDSSVNNTVSTVADSSGNKMTVSAVTDNSGNTEKIKFLYNGDYYTGDIYRPSGTITNQPTFSFNGNHFTGGDIYKPTSHIDGSGEAFIITDSSGVMDVSSVKYENIIVEKINTTVTQTASIDTRKMNELNIKKTTTIGITDFTVKSIRIDPHTTASLDIIINTTNGPIEKTVNLSGTDYANWGADDNYVYYYIRDNFDKIYN